MGIVLRTKQHRRHTVLKSRMAELDSLQFTRERLDLIFWAVRHVLLLVILAAFAASIVIQLILSGHPSTPHQILEFIFSQ
jgi:hypothetical protein